MSEIQETTQDQSVQSPATEAKTNGTPLAEYIEALIEPLRENLQDADRMATYNEFTPQVYRDAILHRIHTLEEKLKKIGEAIDAETDSWAAVDGEGDIGFMTVTSVQGGGGECSIGEWFGQSSRLIGSAGELLAKCEDVDDLDWIGLPRVFLESLKVTEKYLIDSVTAICRDLGEILILEKPEEADDKPMVAYVEKAEEFLEDLRKHDEKRKKRHAEMERFDEYANRVKCAGCPVLVDLCVNHPKEADHLHIMLTIEKDKDNPSPIPKWRVSFFWPKEQDSIGDSGGCLRAILEAKGFPQKTGIELAPCSKLTEGTGMCETMADAGQEVHHGA